jgi:urease accessory protein UreF
MPKSYEDIMKHANELSAYMENDFTGVETPEEAALKAAAFRRAQADVEVLEAVKAAAEAGRPWRVIGEALGTTGEAARQRYSKLCNLQTGKAKDAIRPQRTAKTKAAAVSAATRVAGSRKTGTTHKV